MAEKFFHNDTKTIVVIADTEGREAYLKLSGKCLFYDETEIAEVIEKSGVKYGFENAKNFQKENNLCKELNKPFLIATHTAAKLPEFKYNLLIDDSSLIPAELLKEPQLTKILEKLYLPEGAQLGTVSFSGEGEKGIDIYGNEILPPTSPQELAGLICGAGVIYEAGTLISAVAGFPYIDADNRLAICSKLVFDTDIELSDTEFYHIPCSLDIKGNIRGKGIVEIDGYLKVNGSIDSCSIYTSGSVIVEAEIKDTVILSDGELDVRRAVHSRLASKANLIIRNEVKQSLLLSDSSVLGENCTCSDSSIYALESIKIAVFHSKDKRVICLGNSPYLRELWAYRHKLLQSCKGDENVDLHTLQEKLAETENELLKQFSGADVETAEADIKVDYTGNRIIVSTSLEGQAEVRIYRYSMDVTEQKKRVVFKVENDEIVMDYPKES